MKFYDTSALLNSSPEDLLAEPFLVSDMTLHELEEIKTSGKKDDATKYNARTVTRLLAEHRDLYKVIAYPMDALLEILNGTPITDSNDSIIMATARLYLDHAQKELDDIKVGMGPTEETVPRMEELQNLVDSFTFVTDDLSCSNLAAGVLNLPVSFTTEYVANPHGQQDYKGWIETSLDDGGAEALAMAYSKDQQDTPLQRNVFNTPTNGYVLIKNADADGNTAAIRWDGDRYVPIKYKNLNTTYSGKIRPLNDHQRLAFDLLQNNDITIKLLLGVYGSGKDFLMINHALDLIEKGKFDKIVWVRNNIEVKNSKPIGFLPGDPNAKILPFAGPLFDNLGGEIGLERAITDGIVELQHLGFMRGRSWDRSIIYSSEAENLTKEHIQLLIGRVGKDSTLWLNGDLRQIDESIFERNNGIRQMTERLVGHDRFGMVYLPTTERSETAQMADLLD